METRQSGFTLPEATMALVLLGVAAAGVLLPFSHGAAVQAEGRRMTLAAKLANDLMERVVATPFADVVALGDGHTATELPGQVTDALGARWAQRDLMYANFSREVTYRHACLLVDKPTPDFVLVTVRVQYQGRDVAVLTRLIGQGGAGSA